MGSLPQTSRHVQSLDLSKFVHGTQDEQKAFGTELVEALSTVGFIKFTNHGISKEEILDVFKWVSNLGFLDRASKIRNN